MKIIITNKAEINHLLLEDNIMKIHIDEADKIVYDYIDIKIYNNNKVIASYNCTKNIQEAFNTFGNIDK